MKYFFLSIMFCLVNLNLFANEIKNAEQNIVEQNIVEENKKIQQKKEIILNENEDKDENKNNLKLNTIANTNKNRFKKFIVLKGLNKITGKTFLINTEINKKINFERLEIVVLKCWKSYPEESPENKALLQIFETNPNNSNRKEIFFGWIFSSSPSISSLEHSLYDITLNNCSD